MELVTLAHVQLNRVGSAHAVGFSRQQEVHEIREVANADVGTLRDLVIHVAEEHGEASGSLASLGLVNPYQAGLQPGQVAFNIQGRNVQYGSVYAVCFAHPALKVGSRYFKLEEVEMI